MAICCRPLQGIEVPSSYLNKGRFNWEVSLCTHFRSSSALKWSQHPCKSNRLHFQLAVPVGYDQSQTEAQLQVPKRRGWPKKNSNAAQSLHKPKVSSKTKPAAQQEIHSGEVTENVFQGEQKKHEGHLFKYSEVVPKISFQQYDDQHELSAGLLKYIVQVSKESIEARGWFTIALSGGSIVKALSKLVDEPGIAWSRWHVFWVDERVVPLNHEDSNYKLALETVLKYVDIPNYQIHSIQYMRDANMVAEKYGRFLRELTKPKILSLDPSKRFPCFDMVLLGMGPDGHVASLFPNSLALAEENSWAVAVLNSPKPPPQRISLTLPCINSASHIAFIIFGSSKAEILQRVLERPALPGSLPAQMVRPYYGSLSWFVDKEAASKLSVEAWDDPKRFPAINFGSEKKIQTA